MAKAPAKTTKKKSFKKKEKKNVPYGTVHIQASFNNTIVTFTDPLGNVLAWSSSGSLGFRGSRKGTPFAAQQASLTAANKAKERVCVQSKCAWLVPVPAASLPFALLRRPVLKYARSRT